MTELQKGGVVGLASVLQDMTPSFRVLVRCRKKGGKRCLYHAHRAHRKHRELLHALRQHLEVEA